MKDPKRFNIQYSGTKPIGVAGETQMIQTLLSSKKGVPDKEGS